MLARPTIGGQPKCTVVGSRDQAATAVGFAPGQPTTFPGAPENTQFTVHDSTRVQAQVNMENIREIIRAVGITDVSLPDALGSAPITADVPAFVQADYSGPDYKLTLVQGRSPTVAMPAGVDLAQLG